MKKLLFLLLALLLIIGCSNNTPQPSEQQSIQPVIPPTVPPQAEIKNAFAGNDLSLAAEALKLERFDSQNLIESTEQGTINVLKGATLNGKAVSGKLEYINKGNATYMTGSFYCSIKIGDDSYVTSAPITLKGSSAGKPEVTGSIVVTVNGKTTKYSGDDAFKQSNAVMEILNQVEKIEEILNCKATFKLNKEFKATHTTKNKIQTRISEFKLGKDVVKLGITSDYVDHKSQFNYLSVNGTFYSENCYNVAKAQADSQI